MERNILSVTQINEYIRQGMDSDPVLNQVAIRGEISNYKCYPSGHHYFTLKDETAALKCVMFKGNALRLRFRPENGMQVIALGKITVYPRDGAYQLYCSAMAVDGVGDLHAAFEQLKDKLQKQGLFDADHKKPLPKFPGVIGIVTSPAGAAVHDMLRILRKRYPVVQVRLFPARVQGAEAPGELVAAIQYANAHHLADVLIVGRGGGSIEDLWAFNDEGLAHAIYNSEIPVISAVGHEPDVTISDYVADLRAATPSNAAELAVPDMQALLQTLDGFSDTLTAGMRRQLKSARQQLDALAHSGAMQSPTGYIRRRQTDLQLLKNRLIAEENRQLQQARQRFIQQVSKLDAMSPLKVLTRGYALVQDAQAHIITGVDSVALNETITVTVRDGTLQASVLDIRRNSHESQESNL